MTQIARNLTDSVDGLFKGKHYLIHDRDPHDRASHASRIPWAEEATARFCQTWSHLNILSGRSICRDLNATIIIGEYE
jgi:hypothetical protein